MKILKLSVIGFALGATAFGCSTTTTESTASAQLPQAKSASEAEQERAKDTGASTPAGSKASEPGPHEPLPENVADASVSRADATALPDDASPKADPEGDGGLAPVATTIAWNIAGATLAGSGCMEGGSVIAEPGGTRIVLAAMATDLKPGTALSDRRACAVRIPVEIPLGHYVSRVDHRLGYSLSRSSGTSATLATAIGYFGSTLNPLTVRHTDAIAENILSGVALRTDHMAADSPDVVSMCGARSTSGFIAVNVALTAQRDAGDFVTVRMEPILVREGVEIELSPCP